MSRTGPSHATETKCNEGASATAAIHSAEWKAELEAESAVYTNRPDTRKHALDDRHSVARLRKSFHVARAIRPVALESGW